MVFFLIAAVIIAADLLSKRMIKERIREGEKKELIKDKLYFWRIKNTGCAYSILKKKPEAVLKMSAAAIGLVSGILCIGIWKGSKPAGLTGLSMCLGGAIGNFIDRVKNKGVTDFIYIKKKSLPIFNLADIFVFIGAIVFIVSFLSEDK